MKVFLKNKQNIFKFHTKKLTTYINEINKSSLDLPIEEATIPNSIIYNSPESHEVDLKNIFKKSWIAIDSVYTIKNPGDFISNIVANQPYFITKNEEDTLKAFNNVCSHRAAKVAVGSGNTSQFECPYHGWTYNLNGALTKCTKMKGIKNFSPKNHALTPIKFENWGKNINFLNFMPNDEDSISELLKPAKKTLRDFHFIDDFSDLTFVRINKYKINCNWKIFSENFNESYHLPYCHKKFAKHFDLKNLHTELHEKLIIQTCLSKEQDIRLGKGSVWVYLYPNFGISRYGPWLETNIIYPISEKECQVVMEYFLETSRIEEFDYINKSLNDSELIADEDVALCESVMIGANSDSYKGGRYVPGQELGVYGFHRELLKDYKKI